MAPVVVEDKIDGFILTCNRLQPRMKIEQKGKDKSKPLGMVALGKFTDLIQKSLKMQNCIQKARLYALSERPVLIEGETGTEMALLAQGIHNGSMRSQGPFGSVSCAGQNDEQQETEIFNATGIIPSVVGGTLLIEKIEEMSRRNQQKLIQLIRFKRYMGRGDMQKSFLDVRIIASTDVNLEERMRRGEFLEELYYLLRGLAVRVPPLRERREDLKEKLRQCLQKNSEIYNRYHVLTDGALEILMDYSWPGNLIQVEAFCDYLILTAKKRSIDQIQVKEALRYLYENLQYGENKNQRMTEVGLNPQEQRIREALKRNGGKREDTAKFLGISKSTLWRYMKKYEIL